MTSKMYRKILSPASFKKFDSSKKLCKICGEEAKSYHFGALTCSACAAFFRRTVASQKTYTCKFKEKCKLVNLFSRKICKYCRFEKCLAVGMQPCEVRSISGRASSEEASTESTLSPKSKDFWSNDFEKDITKSSSTQLKKMPKWSDSTPLLNSASGKIYNKAPLRTNISGELPQTCQNILPETIAFLQATILESLVSTAYLNSSALSDYLSGKDHSSLFDHAVSSWIKMDVCNFINNTDAENEMSDVSDKFVYANLQFLEKYYHLDKSIRSPTWIRKFKNPLWQKILDFAKLLEERKLDEFQFATLAHLTLIKIAHETLGNVSQALQPELLANVKNLSKDIQQYYLLNYSISNIAKTFDILIQLVNEMRDLRKIYNKHVLIMFLSQPVPKIPSKNFSSIFPTDAPHPIIAIESLKNLLFSKMNNSLQHNISKILPFPTIPPYLYQTV